MDLIECKRCGGILDRVGKGTTAKCRNCGTLQTIPRLLDDKIADLYERAGHLRCNSEYDRALEIYEHILDETPDDAEAYWSIILCRYGLVYVEDGKSGRRVPTITRIQKTSLLADEDYKAALKHADDEQKKIYKEEAAEIERIRVNFVTISQEEQPYDVFICYKDKDERERPTEDRAIAMTLYNRLSEAGHKVFFAHVSLEDKLGREFEPYIFAALHSAKVMLVLGTRPEYFQATWVKNEWSRFISLIKAGEKKTIIAAYKNMEGWELPDEFRFQAQDMSQVGFIENIVRVTGREIRQNGGEEPTIRQKSEQEMEQEIERKLQEKLEKRLEEELEVERKKQEAERKKLEEERKKQEKRRREERRNTPPPSSPYATSGSNGSGSTGGAVEKKKGCGCGCLIAMLVGLLLAVSSIIYSWDTVEEVLKTYGLWDEISLILQEVGILSGDESEVLYETLEPDYGEVPDVSDPNNPESPDDNEEDREPSEGDEFTEGDLTYRILANGVTLVRYSGSAEELEIPSDVNGYEVVAVEAEALRGNAALRVLVIPASVKTIGANALGDCTALTEVVLPFVGKSATEADRELSVLGYLFNFSVPASLRKVTVTAQSAVPAYAFHNCADIREVIYDVDVSGVGEYAFAGCSQLTNVGFGAKAYTKIGAFAFSQCTALQVIHLPYGVTEMGDSVFSNCSLLEEVHLPDGLESMGRNTFYGCGALVELTIPDSVKSMSLPILENCNRLERLTVPFIGSQISDVESPLGSLFSEVSMKSESATTSGSTGLTAQSVNVGVSVDRSSFACYRIPQSLRQVEVTQQTAVSDFTFMNCDLIQRVIYRKTLSFIGNHAFDGCGDLQACEGELSGDAYIGDYAFAVCSTITDCLIPEGVTRIGQYAFQGCSSVERVVIPSTVKTIGMGAFSMCSSLRELEIQKGVTSIGTMAFFDCSSLKEAWIPTSVKEMSYGIFGGCTALETLVVPYLGASVNDNSEQATLGYCFGGTGSYSSTVNKTSDSSEYTSQAPHNGSTYYYLHYPIPKSLRNVVVTEQTYVTDYAFLNCDLIRTVGYGSKITSVGKEAFMNCSALSNIYYAGSYEDYNGIVFGSQWNANTGEIEVEYNYEFGR